LDMIQNYCHHLASNLWCNPQKNWRDQNLKKIRYMKDDALVTNLCRNETLMCS
jgi:hypothetical protein